jgi:hypothetical protein
MPGLLTHVLESVPGYERSAAKFVADAKTNRVVGYFLILQRAYELRPDIVCQRSVIAVAVFDTSPPIRGDAILDANANRITSPCLAKGGIGGPAMPVT